MVGQGAAAPIDSFTLHAADGSELVLRAWLPAGAIRQVLLSTVGASASDAKVQAVATACAELGVASFALLAGAGQTPGRRRANPFRRPRRSAEDEVVSWLRMLYPAAPIWVVGDTGQASLVAATPADARRIVRRAAALT